jgi:hypothetical protein
MNNRYRTFIKAAGFVVTVIGAAEARAGQQPPPIHGVTGTIATETSIEETTAGGNRILGKAASLLHLNRRAADRNGDAAGNEVLSGFKNGARVTLQNTTGANLTAAEIDRLGDEGVKQMEGTVTAVSLGDRTISLRLGDGTRRTLRLADQAAAGAGKDLRRAGDSKDRVIVYYTNEAGQRVVHYFRRVS